MGKFVLGVYTAFVILASTAFAHAVLVEAVPPVRGSVAGSEVVFRLRFNSRIDASRSTLKLVLPDGKVHSLDMGKQPSPDSLTSKTSDLKSGHHTLRWQVLSVDGHITRGEVPFEVR
jgi:methionine-rich copper-binding protein CopC